MSLVDSKHWRNTFLFLMGMVVFSELYKTVLLLFLGIDMSLPEVLFVPFCFFIWEDIKYIRTSIFELITTLFVWGIFLYLGNEQPGNGSLFTHSRGFLYIFLFCSLFKNEHTYYDGDLLFYISLGSLCGWLLSALMNLFLSKFSEMEISGFSYGNLLAIPLFLSIAFRKDNKSWFYLGILILVIISFTAGLRRVIIVFAISLFLTFVLHSKTEGKEISIMPFVFMGLLSLIIYINIDFIGNIVYDFSPITYHRIFEKTADSFGEQMIEEDSKRLNLFDSYAKHFEEDSLPHGFLKTLDDKLQMGKYNDFPLLELSYTFGYIISGIFIFYFIHCLFRCLRSVNYDYEILDYFIPCIIILVLTFLEGSFLVNPIVTPFTGLCIGKVILFSKYEQDEQEEQYEQDE